MTLFDVWKSQGEGKFEHGVALLHGRPHTLIMPRLLARWANLTERDASPSEYSKLCDVLRKIEVERPETPSLQTGKDVQPMGSESEEVVATPETRALHKRHSHHHALMVAATTDEDRAEQARIIMEEILPELDRLYDLQRGKPTKAAILGAERQTVVGDNFRKLVSLRSRISKLKRDIPNAPNAKRKAQLEIELQENRPQNSVWKFFDCR